MKTALVYQFTPHDLHDWDATEPLLLMDTKYLGRDRKLMLQANRNGFFYVLDRTNGDVPLGKPFVRKLNWASGIGPDGVPQLLPANQPTTAGVKGCPAVRGATNWYSTSFNPDTRLLYVMAVEDCSIYRQSQRGGYSGYRDTSDPGEKYLSALDIEAGKITWEFNRSDRRNQNTRVSTAGSLVIYGETGGTFAAVEAKTGRTLWRFDGNAPWKASPMTYMVNGRQYVAIASGSNILSFAVSALDERIKLSVPTAAAGSFDQWIRDDLMYDWHQSPNGLRAFADIGTLYALIAPRLLLIQNGKSDLEEFPLDEALRSYEYGRRIYELYGAEDQIRPPLVFFAAR